MDNIISVKNLSVSFPGKEAVRGATFELRAGEFLALAGESGSGKTMLCRALLGLPPKGAKVAYNLLERPPFEEMALVTQNAMTALDPAMPVGKQIMEGIKSPHSPAELLARVGIGEGEARARQYPPEFSGGMRQRAAVALALAMNPKVIFADEPTTSLDSDMRRRIVELIYGLRREGRAILFVTHDLSLVRDYADRVIVMKEGRVIEQGETRQVFEAPSEEYTKDLLHYADLNHTHGKIHYHDLNMHSHEHEGEHSHESLEVPRPHSGAEPLVELKGVSKSYPLSYRRARKVLEKVDLAVYPGETVGLCGPSGIGKSTLARCLAGLEKPSSGRRFAREGLKIQMIFQDSVSALNPRMNLEQLIGEPIFLRDKKRPPRETILELMRAAELPPELLADEPVSSLDAATGNKIIHLLKRLKDEYGMSLLLISHDLALLAHVSDRIERFTGKD